MSNEKMLSFHVKFVQTDRWTTVKQYAPNLSIRGHKKVFHILFCGRHNKSLDLFSVDLFCDI